MKLGVYRCALGRCVAARVALGACLLGCHAATAEATWRLPARHDNGVTAYQAPEFRPFGGDGLAIRYASEVFVDQHHKAFDIPLGRVSVEKIDMYRNLFVWREYEVTRRVRIRDGRGRGRLGDNSEQRRYYRQVARYENADLGDFLVNPDGFGVHRGLRPLHATSASIRPMPDRAGWIILKGLEPGTVLMVTDDRGRVRRHVYAPMQDQFGF